MTKRSNDFVDEARRTIPEASTEQTKEMLDRGEVDLLIDVREPGEWEAGHIPGAIHAPRGMLEWYADPTYANHKPELTASTDARIVLHCAAGGRSLLAAKTLQEMGYTNVSSMKGGYNEWVAAGLPTEK
ncbi:MAG: rhodanese-like domain-containing protein [Candidatus Dormibacteraeota bacterium]|uniref:Rhodanese-like domain-containing protein n=1 Tax=Candidatus Dormiibacter inghamiae TaxID=3127013 RepID=A0A934NAW1_9BACT|nr:rhodanese-like domain-containing protein [Candidatus Dormibacteraeota bacterium]MBJ7605578.1 rhodanese-like domain-containing protein [Candidatus Dormibacteraeota bacterium]